MKNDMKHIHNPYKHDRTGKHWSKLYKDVKYAFLSYCSIDGINYEYLKIKEKVQGKAKYDTVSCMYIVLYIPYIHIHIYIYTIIYSY